MAGRFQQNHSILSGCVLTAAGVVAFISFPALRACAVFAAALAAALIAIHHLCHPLDETRQALECARQAKAGFLSNVSHELRTPRNGIHGLAQLLERECENAERRGMALEPATPETRTGEVRCGRVLVVDDNPVNQLVAVRALHGFGYAADAVCGAETALDALDRAHYDAVLMDCQMPGIDGFQTAVEIRRREAGENMSRIPIIAMTANAPDCDRERLVACGMDDYLAKPFRIAELNRALKRWMTAPDAVPRAE